MAVIDTKKRIGDILLKQGIINEYQLHKALEIQRSGDMARRLSEILTDDLGIDRHLVMKSIAGIFALHEIHFNPGEINREEIGRIRKLTKKFDQNLIDEFMLHNALPYCINEGVTIIAADPANPAIPGLSAQLPFKQYEISYCRLEAMEQIIQGVYQQKNEFLETLDEISYEEPAIPDETDEQKEEDAIDAEINQSVLNALVEGMLVEAVHRGASDIHVIPTNSFKSEIHFRVDGKLDLWHTVDNVRPEALSAVVKDKTRNVDRFERESTQDGFIQRKIDSVNIRYRVSIMPIVGEQFDKKFESIVIRVLDDRKVITDLNKLGLQKKARERFVQAIEKPSGIVIITGPTGSGKSTTIIAALHAVMDPSKNVLTVEEPVEYIIKGARQLKIGDHMTFDQSMRGILRHDPDIVLVGEIRDLKTAEVATKLANTGHLTFSTLHTNDAPSAVTRLYTMGVEPFLIANAVNLVMAQRLVRKLCDHCKEEVTEHKREYGRSLGFTDAEIDQHTFYKAVGCDKCTNGYKGRIAIMEALYFDKDIKSIILKGGNDVDEDHIRRKAIENGMLTLRASGRERIKEGITTLDEIAAVTVSD